LPAGSGWFSAKESRRWWFSLGRREKVWAAFITRVRQKTSRAAAEAPPSESRGLVARIKVESFSVGELSV